MLQKAVIHNIVMVNSVSIWKRLRRTPYQAVAAIFMVFLTLFVVAVFLVAAATSSAVLSYFESKPQLTVFFKDEKTKAAIDELVDKLRITGKLASWNYVSKEQALAIYRDQNKNDPLLLEMVTADILPSSLEISATSPQYLSELAELVKKEQGIDEVVFQKEVVDTLVTWTQAVRKVGLVFILFLFCVTFMIILTSISMKIAIKKDEIEILRLVGGTNWYIKRPFIYEGLFYGIVGATFAWFLVSIITIYISPFLSSFLMGIPSLTLFSIQTFSVFIWPFTLPLFILLWVVLMTIGLFIGLIGSLVAVGRYMKH